MSTNATSSKLLKYALLADAVSSALSGVLLIVDAGYLANLFSLPQSLLFYAGIAFLPFAAFVGWTATRPEIPRGFAWAVVALNVVYVLECVIGVEAGFLNANFWGNVFVIGQALAVAGLACAETWGLIVMRRATLVRA